MQPAPERVDERRTGRHALLAQGALEIGTPPTPKGRVLGRAADELVQTAADQRQLLRGAPMRQGPEEER